MMDPFGKDTQWYTTKYTCLFEALLLSIYPCFVLMVSVALWPHGFDTADRTYVILKHAAASPAGEESPYAVRLSCAPHSSKDRWQVLLVLSETHAGS